jgi:Na+-translocating ferredoxin:NAD+ oxidoreductase subunit C
VFRFKGGVSLKENKLTENNTIIEIPIPKEVIIPLHQHVGAQSIPIVKVGDTVKTGQKIGECSGFISASVHSSVTGIVKNIKEYMTPVGINSLSVFIDTQEKDEFSFSEKFYTDYYRYDKKILLEAIKESGIVGLGGASFPTHVKLSPPEHKEIHTVIVNGTECEPYLTSDSRVMTEHARDVVEGLKIVMYILNADNGVICVENNKHSAISSLEKEISKQPNIDLAILETRYPQGSEKQLIYTIKKLKIPPAKLPMDVSCIVHNVSTLCSIKDALYRGKPLIEKVLTVTGDNIENPSNVRVRIGTSIRHILDFCKWNGEASKIIVGGPMMGVTQNSIDVPILKASSGILVFNEKNAKYEARGSCIRCGKCVRACPMNLMPNFINTYTEQEMWDKVAKLNVEDCIECGCCAYVCPSKLPIVQSAKWAKLQLRKINTKH